MPRTPPTALRSGVSSGLGYAQPAFNGLRSSSSSFHLSAAPSPIPSLSASPSLSEASASSAGQAELRLLCLDLSGLAVGWRFVLLSVGLVGLFMLNSCVEEFIFRVLPRFTFGWFLTLVELTLFALFALLERAVRQPTAASPLQHTAPLRYHGYVAVAMTASRGLTNVSLQHLNYPTQVIFKSMKLLSVMAASLCLLRQTFHPAEYGSALCLVVSAVLFSYGDYQVSADSDAFQQSAGVDRAAPPLPSLAASLHVGVVIVLLSLVADAFHATTQDGLMRAQHASTLETMLFTNAFSSLLALLVVLGTGELLPALAFCVQHPMTVPLFLLRAAIIYAGVLCFLLLLKAHGAVTATAVTTVRKILSVILSFLLFPKGWSRLYAYGFLAFCTGLGLSIWLSGRDKPDKQPSAAHTDTAESAAVDDDDDDASEARTSRQRLLVKTAAALENGTAGGTGGVLTNGHSGHDSHPAAGSSCSRTRSLRDSMHEADVVLEPVRA